MFSGEFRKHPEIEGRHAPLSASKYSWLRYDDEKLVDVFDRMMAAHLGTKKHEYAKMAIELGQKQPHNGQTLNMYINDCIGWRMTPEVPLVYSEFIFGTCDAMRYGELPGMTLYDEYRELGFRHLLRASDLKTGDRPTKMDQLLIYVAIFFLEYRVDPADCLIELRIYQNDDIDLLIPSTADIVEIMDHIVHCDEVLKAQKAKA